MAESSIGSVELELKRDLGLFDITMIGIGAMIGAGIFVLTGYAIGGAGPAAMLVFFFNGIVAILTGLTYMELGSCFPEAGGCYLWVRRGMPHPFGFLSGWMDWMAHTVACSLYALGFGSYLSWWIETEGVLEGFSPDVLGKVFAVVIAIILLSVNYMGTGTTGKTENIVTIAKLVLLGAFIIFGIWAMFHNPQATSNFTDDFLPNGFGGLAYGMGLTFIAFQGFEVITQCGEEVKEPRRNIPKAIVISLGVVIAIYIAIAIVTIGAVNGPGGQPTWKYIGSFGELAMVEAAKKFMPFGFLIMIIGGLISTISALNATVFSSSRVSFAMGRDGTLPKSLGVIHKIRRTPSNAIMVTGVILIVMAVTLPIEDVAASADIMFLMLFSFANISLITLRKKMPYLKRGFVVPLVPIVPLIATGLNIALAIYIFQHSPISWYIAIFWIEIGLVGYYFTRGKEEISDLQKIEKLVGVPRRETGKKYHVLVPIANPNNTELIDIASTVAKYRNGDMILLNIAAIPDTIPIQTVDYEFINRRVKIAETLSDYSKSKFNIMTRAKVVVSHKVRDSILETVNKEKANFTIIGWMGSAPRGRLIYGYNIDDVVQFAPSDVAIFKGPLKERLNKILVLPGYAHHGDRAVELAAFLAKENNAEITVVGLVTPDKRERDVEIEVRKYIDTIRTYGVSADEKMIKSKIGSKIVTLSKDYDLLIIGASEKWEIRWFAFGPIQDALARKVKIPLLMVRAYIKGKEMVYTEDMGDGREERTPKQVDDTKGPIPMAEPAPDEIELPSPVDKKSSGETGESPSSPEMGSDNDQLLKEDIDIETPVEDSIEDHIDSSQMIPKGSKDEDLIKDTEIETTDLGSKEIESTDEKISTEESSIPEELADEEPEVDEGIDEETESVTHSYSIETKSETDSNVKIEYSLEHDIEENKELEKVKKQGNNRRGGNNA